MVPWCMCRWLEERLLAAALLVLLASAAAGEKCDLNIPHRPRQGQTLKLIKRDWASHQLVTEVAAILLEEILMYDVVRVNPDLGPVHDFRAISLGEADANFEVWQGGKEAQIEEWVRRGDAFVANSHSTVAASGLYTLKHTVDRYPEAAFYQYLQTPRLQWIFARQEVAGEAAADPNGLCADPEWNCTNFTWQPPACREHTMRCLGLVFHDYTHYTQGILEQQIANNALPLAVQYLTTVSKEREIWEAYASKRDILFQHHYPDAGVDGIPSSTFVPIHFAPKKYGCNSTETRFPTGGFACRLDGKPLQILVSPKIEASPDAMHFASRFRLDDNDYEKLFQAWRDADGDAKVAACRWLQRKGTARWGSWIRFSKQVRMIENFPPMTGCFPTFYLFLLLTVGSAFLFKLPRMLWTCKKRCRRTCQALNPNWEPTDLSDIDRRQKDRALYTRADFTSKLVACKHVQFVEVKMALLRGSMGFASFYRDEENFCLGNGESCIPPPAGSCFRQMYTTPMQVLVYIMTSGLMRTAYSALTFAFATGMVGALLAEVRSTIDKNKQVDPTLQDEDWYTLFLMNMQTVASIMDDFKFLPTFFITYMIGQDVTRWLKWLQTMFSIQGRLHDLGLVIASSYRKLNDPCVGKQQRQMLFKWYRYLNAIHYLAYFKLDPRIGTSPDQVVQDLRTMGLLVDSECYQILMASAKLRDTLVSWLGILWHDELERGFVQAVDSDVFMRKVCDLRGILASLADMPDMQTSQLVRVMMVVVTNILLSLALVGYPTKMYEETKQCFQFWPLVASYLYYVCYRGMLHVMFTLDKGPFYGKGDCVNVDALLVSTERFAFHVFRTSFQTLPSEFRYIRKHDEIRPLREAKEL
ncbi:yciC [Symbiodinium necroappetens]|uniref:YciC protein n=1 Tax=Symbiodinium necroappetens TaxID=1628268 RepID=A0A812TQF8_9DINO|nr:yciC [Symbiodinium necroappetens]